MEELRSFMIVAGVALKEKQKLMRNLRVSHTQSFFVSVPMSVAPKDRVVRFWGGSNPSLHPFPLFHPLYLSFHFRFPLLLLLPLEVGPLNTAEVCGTAVSLATPAGSGTEL